LSKPDENRGTSPVSWLRHDLCTLEAAQVKQEVHMPEKRTLERAARDKRQGKAATTQAGEFVREEMEHVRKGKHGARSTKQAIAIGLSKARSAGVNLPPPKKGTTSRKTRRSAQRAYEKGRSGRHAVSSRLSRAVLAALRREGHSAASRKSLARQAHSAARRRGASNRSAAARKAAATKGAAVRSAAARKAARTRAHRRASA
jgi:hypothetical protein